MQTQTTSPVSELSVDFYPSSLWLSAGGGYVALGSEDDDEQSTIHAGRVGASLAAFTADDAAFAGESTLLLLERQPQESVLRLVDLAESSREAWMLKVPVRGPRCQSTGHYNGGGFLGTVPTQTSSVLKDK